MVLLIFKVSDNIDTRSRFCPYVQSVPQETRRRPSVDAATPFTAPWWPGNLQTVRLFNPTKHSHVNYIKLCPK